jgi:DNA-binding transcriptional LysR family regulator
METQVLRQERLCAAIPWSHPLHDRKTLPWSALAGQPLIVLARREGAGSHDEILAGCRRAGFSPRLMYTPSLVGTILSYVEAGTGIGIVPESVGERASAQVGAFVPLTPHLTIPLVMVWKSDTEEPPVTAFRELICEWLRLGKIDPQKRGTK